MHNCPLENSKECTFCLAQSNATFEVKKLVEPNRFTCTFCNLKLPSVTISRQHVRKEHHILNFEFIPVDINSNNIKKDRFLVCQYKSLKRKKLYNDCILLTESDKSTTTVSKTHSDIVNKHNDFQLTKSPNTLYNSKQNTRRSRDESKEQHKVLNRKHSTKSCNVSIYTYIFVFYWHFKEYMYISHPHRGIVRFTKLNHGFSTSRNYELYFVKYLNRYQQNLFHNLDVHIAKIKKIIIVL